MKIELSDDDLGKLANLVTGKISERVLNIIMSDASWEALSEKGEALAQEYLKRHFNIYESQGQWAAKEVIEKFFQDQMGKLNDVELRRIIGEEVSRLVNKTDALSNEVLKNFHSQLIARSQRIIDKIEEGE